MVLSLFFCFCWLLVSVFFSCPKKLKTREGVFLFIAMLNLNINVSWIIGYELKDILFPKAPTEYLAYLLHRTVIVPVLPLLFVNWINFCRTLPARVLLGVGYVVLIMGVEVICTSFGVYKFVNWNYLYSAVQYASYLLLALLLLKWFRNAFASEEPVL